MLRIDTFPDGNDELELEIVGETAAPPDGKNSQDSYYLPVDLEFFVPVLATCCTQVIIVVVYSSVI